MNGIGLDERRAFLDFNLIPLGLCRDIGILGFLHKANLGLCHESITILFGGNRFNRPIRYRVPNPYHTKPLYTYYSSTFRCGLLYCRSIFYMVEIYNGLSQEVVDASTVHDFQRQLTMIARHKCACQQDTWKSFLSARQYDLHRHLRNHLFLERHIRN